MDNKTVNLDVEIRDKIVSFLRAVVVPAQTGAELSKIADFLVSLKEDEKVAEQSNKEDEKKTA